MPTERLMLLDGYGLVYRGYFALPPLTTSKGELVNGAFGFASIVLRGLQDLQPDYLAVSFDLPGPTFRHEQYAEYKATRTRMPDDLRDQFPKVREIVKALRIPVYEMQGFEADDVIGTITKQLDARDDLETTIVTVDLDMLQLVTPRVRLMTTRSGVENTVMYDVAKIDERFGLRPDQMIDYKALKGDPTDNIPGVPGVGEKTAAKLIRDFGDLDALLARLDEVTPAKLGDKLREHVDQILMGRELSRIVRDLPIEIDLEAARLGDYDRDTVVRLFREYEFRTLIERLPPMAGESRRGAVRQPPVGGRERLRAGGPRRRPARRLGRRAGAGARPESGELQLRLDFDSVTAAPPGGWRRRRATAGGDRRRRRRPRSSRPATCRPRSRRRSSIPGRIEVRGADRIADLARWLAAQPAVGASLVADDPRPRRGTPLALAVAGAGRPGRRRRRRRGGRRAAPPRRGARHAARRPRGQAAPRRPASPRTTDAPATPVAFDTQIAAYILNAALRSQTIADVVAENLDQILPPATELPATARAGLEALSALAVREPLERRLADVGLDRLFREIELPLIPVLARMEAVGVALDREALAALDDEFGAEIDRLEQEIYVDVGHEFNLGSPKQLEQVLFFELNLPKGRKTKTGFSTDASVLEELRPAHPMIDKLLEWRIYTKLRSTYVEALPIADRRARRPAPHDVPPGRRLDRPPVVVRPEPPEHPDPDRARPADPAGVRRRRAGPDAARRRLLPDRAADPRPRLGRRAPQGRVRPARPTSTARPRPGCSTRTRPTSPTTSGRWRRWSTSGSPTG